MSITYDPGNNTITVTGYTETTPCTFEDIYNADKAGTLVLIDRDGITGTDTDPVSNTYNLRPADEKVMGGAKHDLWITIENWSGFTNATIRLIGKDEAGNDQTEDIVVTGNGTYYSDELWTELTQTQVVGVSGSGGFDYCYSKDTEILTKDGWKLIRDVKEGELVWTLNPKTHELELGKVKRKISYHYKGKMYHQTSPFFDLLVTPNHRNYVQRYLGHGKFAEWELIEATKIPKDVKYKRNAIWRGKEEQYFFLPATTIRKDSKKLRPKIKIPMDLWLKFLGLYLSEGHTQLRVNKSGSYAYCVILTQSKAFHPNVYYEIKKVLNQLPFKYREDIDEKGVSKFTIFNKQLYDYCKQFGKDDARFIPKQILNLSSRQLRILFDYLMLGDDWGERGKGEQFGTISERLAKDFQELVLKVGLACSEQIIKGNKGFGGYSKPFHRFLISFKHGLEPRVNRGKNTVRGWESYDDKVHCVEAEKNHIIYVRRNGKPVWSGNCLIQGQWGVVWKTGDFSFLFDAKLYIDPSSWFIDSNKTVIFRNLSGYPIINVLKYAHFYLGTIVDETDKVTKDGCTLIFDNCDEPFIKIYYNAIIRLYSSTVKGSAIGRLYWGTSSSNRFWNCQFYKARFREMRGDFFNVLFVDCSTTLDYVRGTMEDVKVWNSGIPFRDLRGATLKNVDVKNCADITVVAPYNDITKLINCNVDKEWVIYYAWDPGGYVYRQYEFDLKVIDKDNNPINGASVKIWDLTGTLVVDTVTDENGSIPTQTLTWGFWYKPNGDDPTMKTPHTLRISKAGYQTYEKEFTLDKKIDWTIALEHSNICVDQEAMLP